MAEEYANISIADMEAAHEKAEEARKVSSEAENELRRIKELFDAIKDKPIMAAKVRAIRALETRRAEKTIGMNQGDKEDVERDFQIIIDALKVNPEKSHLAAAMHEVIIAAIKTFVVNVE